MKIDRIRFTGGQGVVTMVTPVPPEERLAPALRLARTQKGSLMAGRCNAPGRAMVRALKTTVIVAGLAAVSAGVALAQTAAPIVYKSASPATGFAAPRFENRVDSLSLNVAPHAPIPTFGPAPMASAGKPEALPLRTAIVPAMPTAEQKFVAPYAGPPYQVDGRWYVPAHEPNYDEVGIASWYGPTFHGKSSASGETFDENELTAAHPTLPIPSLVRVTNLENGRSVVVRLNDRGPFVDDRIIDLSKAAGAALDMHAKGTARVRVQYVGPAPAEGGGVAATAPAQRVDAPVAMLPPAIKPVVAFPTKPVGAAQAEQFFVQAGSFAELGNAHVLRDRLAPNGRVSIEATTVNGAEFYRVLVGPWGSRDEADAARQKLGSTGRQGLVVARGR